MAKHQTLQCQNCGAPLGIPEDHDRFFTCKYCGSVLEDVTPPAAKHAGEIRVSVAQDVGIDPSSLATYAKPAKAVGCTVLVGILVAVAVGAIGLVVAARSITGTDSPLTSSGSQVFSWAVATDVPSDDSTGRDVVGVARTSDELQTVYLDPDADEPVRWSVERALEDETFVQFVPTEELVVVSAGAELFALNRATGDEAWSARLSDVVQPNICTDCARRFGDVVTTLSADGVLAAHSVADGQQRWSVRLAETPRQIVDLGGNPAVLDTSDDTTDLRVFSAADGTLLERVPVSCPNATFGGRAAIGIYDHLVPVGDGTVVWLGGGAFGSCAGRWAAGTGGVPMWEVPYEHPNPAGVSPGSVVVAGGSLVLADRTVVDVFDLATGATRRVADRPDTELFPIGLHEGTVVLAEKNTRGTTRWSVVALDLGAGNERWRFEPEVPERIEASRSFAVGDAWTAAMTSKGVAVVQHHEDANDLAVQTIPVASGTASSPVTIDLSGRTITDMVSTHGWSGDDLLLSVGGDFVVLDAAGGRIRADIG